ncbi:MAG: hypothetical protein WCR20_13450, partial [Verrucomicrobiota bacterium]
NLPGTLGLPASIGVTNRPTCIASNVVAAATQPAHTSFVLADGTLWSLGKNLYGEIGNGLIDTNVYRSPVQVMGLTVASLSAGCAANH